MRCYQCGKECELTHTITNYIRLGIYQITRYYSCPNCGNKYEITEGPKG